MSTRQKLIRFPFMSFATGAAAAAGTAGTSAEWTHGFAPIGDRPVLNGQEVELHAALDAATAALTETTPLWFDIVDENFLLSGADQDCAARIASAGSSPPAAAFPNQEERQPVFQRLEPGQTWTDFAQSFKRDNPSDYASRVLILEEEIDGARRFHALTWWQAQRIDNRPNPRMIFQAHLGPDIQAQTAAVLAVSSAPAADGALQFALQYEDGSPMAEAEIQVEFADNRTLTAFSDEQGVARIDAPVGADEQFRVFLLSYPQTYADVPGEPPPPAPPVELNPEVVTVFAFDSSFPVPSVYAALARVRDNARLRPDVRVRLYGHTDPHGSVEYNQGLSERRAKTVLALLANDLAMFDEIAASESWNLRHYQAMLRGLGCNPGAIDGDEGAMTREATRRFQSEYNLFSFHRGLTRRYGNLTVDGSLNNATRAALRDAYVAWAPHLPAGRLADPPFVGCSENQPVSDQDWENRRVTVVYRTEGELAAESGDLCAAYRSVVPQEKERPSGPRFVDFEWLLEESGSIHLSALASMPDGTSVQFTVYPVAQSLPQPAPDSSTGQPRPEIQGPAVPVPGQVSGGVAFARWNPGAETAGRIFDYTTWLVDHDFQVEIEDENDDVPPDGPGRPETLWEAPSIHPPVFAIDSGEHWGFSDPPGQALERVQFANEVEPQGLALRADGTLVEFSGRDGWLERASFKTGDDTAAADVGTAGLDTESVEEEVEEPDAAPEDGEAANGAAPVGTAPESAEDDHVYGWAEVARPTYILALALAQQGVGTVLAQAGQGAVGQAPAAPPAYGGYNLRRNDQDGNHTYGGAQRTVAAGDTLPAAGATGFVQQLQEDLHTLGFHIVGPRNGTFGRQAEWAVREFQIYAKMENIAQENTTSTATRYVDRLSQVANTDIYAGPVSGVANARTRTLIQTWLNNNWRCPVVIEAWNMRRGARTTVRNENVWLHDEVATSAPRFFARDFSGYYTFPATRNANDLIVLGDFVTYLTWSGPRSLPPNHTWIADPPTHPTADGEILPDGLIGTGLAALTAAQRSTFKVVRAVAEVECIGFFDSLNAYDNAFMSLGPCHWTLGTVPSGSNVVSGGELCGYLAYLRQFDNAAFTQAIEFFGVRVHENWLTPGTPATASTPATPDVANGRALFNRGTRTFTGRIALQQENSSFTALALDEDEWNYFKTWHWFYRFQMAGRTIDGFRRRMWDMARIRLRDIRSLTFPAGTVPDIPTTGGGTRRATVGDVFTSEKAMALLLRWHIRFPGRLVRRNLEHLRNAITHAAIPAAAGDPTAWTDAHQTSLIDGIMHEVGVIGNQGFTDTMEYVRDWPTWAARGAGNRRRYSLTNTIGNLATTRNSFIFDATGLPPVP